MANPTGKLLAVSFGSLLICGGIALTDLRTAPPSATSPVAIVRNAGDQALNLELLKLYRQCLQEAARHEKAAGSVDHLCAGFSPERLELALQPPPPVTSSQGSSIPFYALIVSSLSCLISLLGAISTAILGWRKERRETRARQPATKLD